MWLVCNTILSLDTFSALCDTIVNSFTGFDWILSLGCDSILSPGIFPHVYNNMHRKLTK